jgi:epoxyqueuosine reductase
MSVERVSFSDQIRAAARALSFDAVGFARADVRLEQDVARYDAFIAAGMHGDMGWLAEHGELRASVDGEGILAGARSVICVARRYQRPGEEEASHGPLTKSIARYARGRDYHKFLRKRLRRLATFVRSLGAPDGPLPERVYARPMLDDVPVLERAWAARAGLGFVGKNGMLIIPGTGSMVLLGEVVTTLELPPDVPMNERCGTCTRCLDACPTQAFAAPFVLDARRCISYLTIEQRGPMAPELRASMGEHVFGCDDCQTVCPFNAAAGARAPATRADGDPFAPLERWSRVTLEELLSLDDVAWDALSDGSPLRRLGRADIARNAAVVLGNRGDASALQALRRAAESHDDATVRDAAAWAIARLGAQT